MNRLTKEWYDAYYQSQPDMMTGWNAAIETILQGLRSRNPRQAKIVDLGCGRGDLLRALLHNGVFAPHEVVGVEQSPIATANLERTGCHVVHADLQRTLPFDTATFDYVVVAEVVEHLLRPTFFLREVARITRPGGRLVLSFPNYVNLPWLAARLAAEWLNRPQMINLQPIDRVLFYPQLKSMVIREGFGLESVRGTYYFPPLPHGGTIEPAWLTRLADCCGLQPLSFHPVLVFRRS